MDDLNTRSVRPRSKGRRPKLCEIRDREERLLEHALEAFLERGLAATIDEIAISATMSKRTIYARYRDKRELFVAATRHLFNQRTRQTSALDTGLPLPALLSRFIRLTFESGFAPEFRKLHSLARRAGDEFPELLEPLTTEPEAILVRPLAAHLDALSAQGVIRPVDTLIVAQTIVDSIFAQIYDHLTRGRSSPDEAFVTRWVTALSDIYFQGLTSSRKTASVD